MLLRYPTKNNDNLQPVFFIQLDFLTVLFILNQPVPQTRINYSDHTVVEERAEQVRKVETNVVSWTAANLVKSVSCFRTGPRIPFGVLYFTGRCTCLLYTSRCV